MVNVCAIVLVKKVEGVKNTGGPRGVRRVGRDNFGRVHVPTAGLEKKVQVHKLSVNRGRVAKNTAASSGVQLNDQNRGGARPGLCRRRCAARAAS